jgi:BASS family bile acid:Na+ symporter
MPVRMSQTYKMSMVGMSLRIILIVALPVALGMALRGTRPGLAARLERPTGVLCVVLFACVLAIAIWAERERLPGSFAAAGLAALALNLLMMALACWGTVLLGCARAQRIALSLECGLQNGTLAIAVVATLGLDTAYAVPAAIYSILMFGTALGLVAMMRAGRLAAG